MSLFLNWSQLKTFLNRRPLMRACSTAKGNIPDIELINNKDDPKEAPSSDHLKISKIEATKLVKNHLNQSQQRLTRVFLKLV